MLRAGDPNAIPLARAVLSESWEAPPRDIKRDDRTSVRRARAADRDIVIKSWRLSRPKDLLNTLLIRTPGRRHWRGAARLARLGASSAPCLALLRSRAGLRFTETLLLEAVPGATLLEHLDMAARGASPFSWREQRELARAVGAQVRGLTTQGWFNRDHKPSNLIVNSPNRVVMIDVVAIRRDRERTGGARMLTSLMLEPMGVGCVASRTMRMRVLKEASGGASLSARKMAWRGIAERIAAHGDPRPKINPLERPTP